jgi:hypothetical protein
MSLDKQRSTLLISDRAHRIICHPPIVSVAWDSVAVVGLGVTTLQPTPLQAQPGRPSFSPRDKGVSRLVWATVLTMFIGLVIAVPLFGRAALQRFSDVEDLAPGQCVVGFNDLANDAKIGSYLPVSCYLPHRLEVIALITVAGEPSRNLTAPNLKSRCIGEAVSVGLPSQVLRDLDVEMRVAARQSNLAKAQAIACVAVSDNELTAPLHEVAFGDITEPDPEDNNGFDA